VVLGGRVELGGGYRSKVKVAYVEVPYFENQGNSLRFEVSFEVLSSSYAFSIRLFMVNYAPVTPLPGTSINSDFYLKFYFKFVVKGAYLSLSGGGSVDVSYYAVDLEQFRYGMEIFVGDIKLNNNCNNVFIIKMLVPTPISSLV